MGHHKKDSMKEIERDILKIQIKNEVIEELDNIIVEKLKKHIGPAVAESIGSFLEIPVSVKQLAAMMGRSADSVYKMIQRDQIPYTKVGGRVHINLRDVSQQLLSLHDTE